MKLREQSGNIKIRRSVLAALCLLTVLALAISGGVVTFARYLMEKQSEGAAVAKPFYFSSDKLAEDAPYYQIDQPGQGQAVELSFTLSNFVDRLRRTDGTVRYAYRALDSSGAVVSGTEGEGELSGSGFTTSPEIKLALQSTDFGNNGFVTVVAESTAPYEKTISAQFGFTAEKKELQAVVSQQGDAVVVELAGGDGGNVTVAWPDALSPDLSNAVFEGAAAGSVTFAAESGARYALTFLKHDPSVEYTAEDFQITQP